MIKVSIVIICWNDHKVIFDCLKSIFEQQCRFECEVIVSDNGSTDGAPERIRKEYPQVRIVANGNNLGFAKGNNAGIKVASGEYVLILNPDTIVHENTLQRWLKYADSHPEAGAFGCRVLNPDGSYQTPARPLPTLRGAVIAALGLRWLGRLSAKYHADTYPGFEGDTERPIGMQSGCCILVRGPLLTKLGGFDERFFYHFEETDLCKRTWESGCPILYFPDAVITHLGGQSVGRFPIRFALETNRGRYRYFYKHFGMEAAERLRWAWLMHVAVRWIGYSMVRLSGKSDGLSNRLAMYRTVLRWNWHLNVRRFIELGDEPDVGHEPLAPAPVMVLREESR